MATRSRLFAPFLASLVVLTLLTGNVAVTARHGGSLSRYWQDMSVAIKSYLDWRFPQATVDQGPPDLEEAAQICKTLVLRWTRQNGVHPWQPWRTMGSRRLLAIREKLAPPMRWEDTGRPMALYLGFRLLGGVSPYLILWLGVVASVPIFAWTCWESFDAGHGTAGTVFLLTVASSPYFTHCLWWGHSAAGFYLLGLLAVAPLAVYSVLGRRVSRPGLYGRSVMAGALFACCALFRSGTLVLFPGFFLALVFGSFRLAFRDASQDSGPGGGSWRLRQIWGPLLVASLLFWTPHLILRQPQHHDVWISIWEGLGDFDRTKGHRWEDAAAIEALQGAGLATGLNADSSRALYELVNEESTNFFRESVLEDIKTDPGWYVAILGKRVFATLTQAKLWPWGPRDGRSMEPKEDPNQGEIDNYYRATATADFLAFGRHRVEMPVTSVAAPTLLLLLVWVAGRSVSFLRASRDLVGKELLVVLCVATAALGLPVIVTTAAPQETQAISLAYFLAFGFLVGEVGRVALSRAQQPQASRGVTGSRNNQQTPPRK